MSSILTNAHNREIISQILDYAIRTDGGNDIPEVIKTASIDPLAAQDWLRTNTSKIGRNKQLRTLAHIGILGSELQSPAPKDVYNVQVWLLNCDLMNHDEITHMRNMIPNLNRRQGPANPKA